MTSLFDNVEIVNSNKTFRIPSETMLQHSVFDRIRQRYLLKNVNRCTGVMFRIPWMSEHISELGRMTLRCPLSLISIERVMVKYLLEIEPLLHWNSVCSTKMFRINIKTASATLLLVCST